MLMNCVYIYIYISMYIYIERYTHISLPSAHSQKSSWPRRNLRAPLERALAIWTRAAPLLLRRARAVGVRAPDHAAQPAQNNVTEKQKSARFDSAREEIRSGQRTKKATASPQAACIRRLLRSF